MPRIVCREKGQAFSCGNMWSGTGVLEENRPVGTGPFGGGFRGISVL